ncbi:MAG: FecR family protein [Bacteroidales bacterium]|nr:FecR family protein [Bacteroidales bacterium]
MEVSGLKELLKKYREKRCTGDELEQLNEWISDEHNEEHVKELLLEDLNIFTVSHSQAGTMDFDCVYKKIVSSVNQNSQDQEIKPGFFRWHAGGIKPFLKIAAAIIALFFAGGALSYFLFNHPEEHTVIAFNEIKAPLGARSEVVLPDGSKVWLNAGSRIRYHNVFNETNRNILLEGEAYFKVAKRSRLPFIVKTGDIEIVATGTEFNVKAYSDEDFIETTLVEGKVFIRGDQQLLKRSPVVSLEPNQKAVFVKENRQLTVEDLNAIRQTKSEPLKLKQGLMYVTPEVDPLPVVSWKDNRLIFKGEELSDLIIKLERKYNVTFCYESENVKHFRFTGTLEDETLTQVLDVIKLSAPIDYTINGKEVRISENMKMLERFNNHMKKK